MGFCKRSAVFQGVLLRNLMLATGFESYREVRGPDVVTLLNLAWGIWVDVTNNPGDLYDAGEIEETRQLVVA